MKPYQIDDFCEAVAQLALLAVLVTACTALCLGIIVFTFRHI